MWTCPKCGREFRSAEQHHFCGKISTIDDYIADQPEEVQPLLQTVRETIRAVAPEAVEKISWQMPTFWVPAKAQDSAVRGGATEQSERPEQGRRSDTKSATTRQGENLVHFAAFKSHIGLYPGGEAAGVFAERLTGYKTSKGSIQFPLSEPIDHELIADIVRWRVEQAKGGKSTFAEPTTREKYPMPDFVAAALDRSKLWERYHTRPPYQQNDYIGWIMRAKREETRQKRLAQMLEELQAGDAYMGMAYRAKG